MCRWTFIKLLDQRNAGSSSSLKKTVLEFLLMKQSLIAYYKPHTQHSYLLIVKILTLEVASPRSRVVSWGLLARKKSEANKWWWCQMTCLTIIVFLSRDIRGISNHIPPNALVMPHTVNWLMKWYVFPSPSLASVNPLLPCLLFQMTQRSIEILLGYWTEYLWTEVSCQSCGSRLYRASF